MHGTVGVGQFDVGQHFDVHGSAAYGVRYATREQKRVFSHGPVRTRLGGGPFR
jgi:hypothetical protein